MARVATEKITILFSRRWRAVEDGKKRWAKTVRNVIVLKWIDSNKIGSELSWCNASPMQFSNEVSPWLDFVKT